MYSFKILAFLLTCLLTTVATNGRDVKDKGFSKKKTTWNVYLEDNDSRIVLTTEENGRLSDCYISGDDYVIAMALQTISSSRVLKLDRKTMNSLIHYCTYSKWSHLLGSSGQDMYQELGMMSGMFIYPGTKWCGAGNISESYDDLGPEVETDMCCREHDHCPDSVEAFGSKHGLDNNSPFTKSHCRCDETFYNCLREANTESSNDVGKIFFNYIRMECFKLEYPSTCSKYKGIQDIETWIGNYIKIHFVSKRYLRPRCVEYELDEEQKRIWQFFDAKEYKPIGEDRRRKLNKQDAFDYILSPSLNTHNQTKTVTDKEQISSYLMNLTLNNILKNKNQVENHQKSSSRKTKGEQLEEKRF